MQSERPTPPTPADIPSSERASDLRDEDLTLNTETLDGPEHDEVTGVQGGTKKGTVRVDR